MPERELHYHVTDGGRQGTVLTDRLVAGTLAAERVAQVVHERGRAGNVETRRLRYGGTLIEWSDETPVMARRDPDDPDAGYVAAEGPAERAYISGHTVIGVAGCNSDHAGGDELMTATAEVWLVGVNKDGPWNLTGHDALRIGPVTSSVGIAGAVEALMARAGAGPDDVAIWHGTSCRDELGAAVQTHIALVNCPDILEHWPLAKPIPMELFPEFGQPPAHGPTEVPDNPYIWVLMHAWRHLAFLLEYDSDQAATIEAVPYAAALLRGLAPKLFKMYKRGEATAPARAA
jgi:hypothetical protein